MTPATDTTTQDAVEAFSAAFDRHDVEAVMAAMTPDCTFESTTPPDGTRHQGQEDVRAAWAELFASSPDATFDTEDCLISGDRAVVTWVYRWSGDAGSDGGHVRGVDLFLVRDGKVAEKRSYVKG